MSTAVETTSGLPGGGARAERVRDERAGAVKRSPVARFVAAISGGVGQILLALIAVFWMLPTIGLFIASLRPAADSNRNGWWNALTEPAQLTFDNYRKLLENDGIVNAFWNTVWISVPATLLVIVLAALAAYAFAWMDFPGRDWAFIGLIALIVVPIQVALIPVAKLYGEFGLYGTRIGVILFHVAFGLPFAVFLLRNYFSGIPRDLLEAARMDGASEWTLFRKVVLPLGLPAIASLGIFQFLWVWNDMLVSLVYSSPQNAPLTVALQGQVRQFGSNIDVLATGAFVSMIVPMLVFFAFQRYFVQGVMAGSVK